MLSDELSGPWRAELWPCPAGSRAGSGLSDGERNIAALRCEEKGEDVKAMLIPTSASCQAGEKRNRKELHKGLESL